ncbi:MAG: GntR family transcriptional regulator [Sulfitobacter sp.]
MNATLGLRQVVDGTLRAQVARQIIDMVTGGRFEPGQKLTETSLATELGVSRAPLREAIRELIDKGILVSRPYKGLYVRAIDRKDLEELYSMRTALEKFAFTLAWPNRDTSAIDDLKARYQRLTSIQETGDQARTIEFEIDFHSWVYDHADHDLLRRHWTRLATLVRIYMAAHHNLHGSHGEFKEMSMRYKDLAIGDSLADVHAHIDEHMKQGLDAVLKAIQSKA